MRKVKEWFANLLESNGVALVFALVILVVGLASPLRNMETWVKYLGKAVQAGVVVNAASGKVEPRSWFSLVLFVLCLSWLIWAIAFIQAEGRRRNAKMAGSERKTTGLKTLDGMMRAAALIRNQMVPPSTTTLRTFHSIKIEVNIDKDWMTKVSRENVISCVGGVMHYWVLNLQGSSCSKPMDYLDDINFKIHNESIDSRVVYLPTKNDPLSKQVVLYFLPQMQPGDPPRTVKWSYSWPEYNGELRDEGREEMWFRVQSANPVDLFELEIYIEDLADKTLTCEESGYHYAESSITEKTYPGKAGKGYVYVVRNAPAGQNRFAISVKLA